MVEAHYSNVCPMPHFPAISDVYSNLASPRSSESDVITDLHTTTPELEEGLIQESSDVDEYSVYNPAFEWQEEDESDTSSKARSRRSVQSVLRLVVLQSSILPSKRKVAVLDTYHEAQIGRDVQPTGSVTPRIRLKEMEVSKVHATIYWDGSRKEWNVVDMGSKHGTFLQSGTGTSDSPTHELRLSQPRFASMPRRLRDGDKLSIGSTTFAIHVHENQRPCQDCSVSGSVEIPLFPVVQKRTRDLGLGPKTAGPTQMARKQRDPKNAMTMLKRALLKLHDEPKNDIGGAGNKAKTYVDRAARRRMLHNSSHSESPGVPSMSAITGSKDTDDRSGRPTAEPTSQPAVPINPSNIGHRLLVQQGWTPGSALGDPSGLRDGLIDPLEVKLRQNRVGLGSKH